MQTEKSIRVRLRNQRAELVGPQHKWRLPMLTQKTSITVLALAAGLTLCLAPQIASADDSIAPPGSSMGGWMSPGSPGGQMEKHLDDVIAAGGTKKVVLPSPSPAPTPELPVTPTSTAPAKTTTGDPVPQLPWYEELALRAKMMAIMVWSSISSSKEEVKTEQSKVEQPKTAAEPAPVIKTTAVPEKTVNLKTVEMKHEVVEILAPQPTTKLVLPEASKPAELNLNTVENIKEKGKEAIDTPAPKATTKLVTLEAPKAKIVPVLKATTTVIHPTVSIVHPVVNVPHPTINIPHPTINIPVIVRR
jgi:hypothetical protein